MAPTIPVQGMDRRPRPLPDHSGGLRDRALVDQLAEQIQARILTGEIPIGCWLRQEALAAEFEVSRTPVREALRKLQASGVVMVIPNRGALVRGPTVTEIREAYLVRAELEALAAELAAVKIDDDELKRLRQADVFFSRAVKLHRSRRTEAKGGDNEGYADSVWVRANNLFHEAVLEAAGNERLSAVILDLHRAFPRNVTLSALLERPELLPENVRQHGEVRRAIEARNPVAARTAMKEHVLQAGELVASWFERYQNAGLNKNRLPRDERSGQS